MTLPEMIKLLSFTFGLFVENLQGLNRAFTYMPKVVKKSSTRIYSAFKNLIFLSFAANLGK